MSPGDTARHLLKNEQEVHELKSKLTSGDVFQVDDSTKKLQQAYSKHAHKIRKLSGKSAEDGSGGPAPRRSRAAKNVDPTTVDPNSLTPSQLNNSNIPAAVVAGTPTATTSLHGMTQPLHSFQPHAAYPTLWQIQSGMPITTSAGSTIPSLPSVLTAQDRTAATAAVAAAAGLAAQLGAHTYVPSTSLGTANSSVAWPSVPASAVAAMSAHMLAAGLVAGDAPWPAVSAAAAAGGGGSMHIMQAPTGPAVAGQQQHAFPPLLVGSLQQQLQPQPQPQLQPHCMQHSALPMPSSLSLPAAPLQHQNDMCQVLDVVSQADAGQQLPSTGYHCMVNMPDHMMAAKVNGHLLLDAATGQPGLSPVLLSPHLPVTAAQTSAQLAQPVLHTTPISNTLNIPLPPSDAPSLAPAALAVDPQAAVAAAAVAVAGITHQAHLLAASSGLRPPVSMLTMSASLPAATAQGSDTAGSTVSTYAAPVLCPPLAQPLQHSCAAGDSSNTACVAINQPEHCHPPPPPLASATHHQPGQPVESTPAGGAAEDPHSVAQVLMHMAVGVGGDVQADSGQGTATVVPSTTSSASAPHGSSTTATPDQAGSVGALTEAQAYATLQHRAFQLGRAVFGAVLSPLPGPVGTCVQLPPLPAGSAASDEEVLAHLQVVALRSGHVAQDIQLSHLVSEHNHLQGHS